MKIRNIIIIVLCFLMTSCVSQIRGSESESAIKVREYMEHAAALEKAEAYRQAAKEYAIVAEQYPSTSYYKQAVWKAGLLNIHPDNHEIDYNESLRWLNVYLEQALSPAEKESATVYVAVVEHINDLQAQLSSMAGERDKLLEITRKQSNEIESETKRRNELEAELAKALDELNEMKAVDVRMHRSRVDKSVGKPDQSVKKVPEAKTNKVVMAPQNKQYTPEKDQEFYPYMIQVSSYKKREDSEREAMILRDKGDAVCISHVRIAGKGDWYRVLVGFYRTPEEAKQAVLELKKREYDHAFVVRPPFTVELGIFSDNEKLKKHEAELVSKGYSAYDLPNGKAKNEIRLLVGAFWTEKEAQTVTNKLLKEGFTPKVVRR